VLVRREKQVQRNSKAMTATMDLEFCAVNTGTPVNDREDSKTPKVSLHLRVNLGIDRWETWMRAVCQDETISASCYILVPGKDRAGGRTMMIDPRLDEYPPVPGPMRTTNKH
jgi:hypothetical protein